MPLLGISNLKDCQIDGFDFLAHYADKVSAVNPMESKRKKPRLLTLTLPNASQPILVLHGKNYFLRNFSDEGLGVWINPPLPKDLSSQKSFPAQILLNQISYTVELELAHTSSRLYGIRIISDSQELKKKLSELLTPSLHASALSRQMLPHLEDPENGFPRIFYSGKNGCELLIWYHPTHHYIQAMQACFLGKWIYRAQNKERKMGLLIDNFKGSNGSKILNTDLINVDNKELNGIPEKASQFLTSLPLPLPGHLLWQFYETGETVFLPEVVFNPPKAA